MTSPEKQSPTAGSPDSIRIVPLAHPASLVQPLIGAVPRAVAPHLSYRGGPLLTAVEVFTIFWGDAWTVAEAPLAAQLNSFFDFILSSALIDQLAEYSVPGRSIGHGRRTGTVTLRVPAPPSAVSDGTLQAMIQEQIGGATLPAPTSNSLYFIFLPVGVTVSQGGGRSCQAFCGYHSSIADKIFYAVMPFPGCTGCTGGLSTVDALMSTVSHELCEAITDPVPGRGWYDDTNGEIGDICAWKTKKVGSYTVQSEWSNASGTCG